MSFEKNSSIERGFERNLARQFSRENRVGFLSWFRTQN